MPIELRKIAKGPLLAVAVAIGVAVTIDLLWFGLKFPYGQTVLQPGALPPGRGPALVLGAGVKASGEPTQVLEGRLSAALQLYRQQKVPWILVSGDNRTMQYNEPQAMRRWLEKRGVPGESIVSDYAGRRTHGSLVRAREVFGLDRLVVVTSDFHMARALFLAKRVGIDAVGVQSDTSAMGAAAALKFRLREYLARHRAQWDVWSPPPVILGPKEDTPSVGH